MVWIMGMKAALGSPWLLRASEKKNTWGPPWFLTAHSPVCSLEGFFGGSFYGKNKQTKKEWKAAISKCLAFALLLIWLSRMNEQAVLFGNRESSISPSSQDLTQPGDLGQLGSDQRSNRTRTLSPGCSCVCLGFTLKLNTKHGKCQEEARWWPA